MTGTGKSVRGKEAKPLEAPVTVTIAILVFALVMKYLLHA
jgi:hypothetical protein